MNQPALFLPSDAQSYRIPMLVTRGRLYNDSLLGRTKYALCPRCESALDRDYVAYCCHCGQALDWRAYRVLD